jgi:cephalosporin-C deacetylase-like acetyl esterase
MMQALYLSACLFLVLTAYVWAEEEAPYPRNVTQETLSYPEELSLLQKPGKVFFQDGFELPHSLENWFGRIGEDKRLTQVTIGPGSAHSGEGVLQLRTEDRNGASASAGCSYWFYPGYDTVYFRRYIKFADDYDQGNLNHVGGSLYAVAGDSKWAEMGKAGVRPEGDDCFGAAFEPWRDWKRNAPPGAMMFYTYWMDMKRDRDGNYWGNMFAPPKPDQIVLKRGLWYCLEQMIKANTPGQADGEMAGWIDGKLYVHLKGFRWRTSQDVRLKRISLGLYIHQSRRPNMVWYDDVALSTGYIGPTETGDYRQEGKANMGIRDYLCRVAAEVTDNSLANIKTKEQWLEERPKRLQQYLEIQGIQDFPQKDELPPLNVTITGVVERDDVTIEKLYYESLPQLYVSGNLYIPKNLNGPAPAVIYVCGHSDDQKTHYQPHARRWAQLGFVTLIVETIQRGEIKGMHHGCYRFGQWQWYSLGYTPAGVEAWNAIRGIDLLQEREEVDPEKIGITGISGGGATSWWAAAADERIKVAAPVCGTGTVRAHVKDCTWDGHCDCMMFINTYQQDLADCGALIAPRPLMVASADRDGIYSIASIRETYNRVKKIYDLYGAGGDCQLVETPGGHSYHRISRTRIFSFFIKHLMGKDVPPESIEDVGEEVESKETLRVYADGFPPDERVSTIQESFVPVAEAPEVESMEELAAAREKLVETLREKTFGHFPEQPCDLDMQVDFEYMNGDTKLARLAFTSERDWRLHAKLVRPAATQDKKSPVLVFLYSPGADSPAGVRGEFEGSTGGLDPSWVRLAMQCRGIGETSWGQDLQWHIRRNAAITGRTIASMRVYDALRAIELARGLPGVDPDRVAVAGRGQMAAVALYAALLDGRLEAVILEQPPATQNAPSNPDGTGDTIEMLNCLRFTDLPYVAGLLCPADLVLVSEYPETYQWTEALYSELGGKLYKVGKLAEYRK